MRRWQILGLTILLVFSANTSRLVAYDGAGTEPVVIDATGPGHPFPPSKMVEPDVVAVSRGPAQTVHPPFVSSFLHHIPAVKRISPALSRLAEKVGRHAGHYLRLQRFIQLKQITMSPNVGAVIVDENCHIANDANGALRAVSAQSLPLLGECELQRFTDLQVDA